MPKHLEKSAAARILDDNWESAVSRAASLHRARTWRDSPHISPYGRLSNAIGLDGPLSEHLDKDWFGIGGDHFWVADETAGRTCELVIGHGLIEGGELSLGLDRDEPLDDYVVSIAEHSGISTEVCLKMLNDFESELPRVAISASQRPLRRNLPADHFWICDMPMFETYLSFNERQLTIIIMTAAIDAPMFTVTPQPEELESQARREWRNGVFVVQGSEEGVVTALLDGHPYGMEMC